MLRKLKWKRSEVVSVVLLLVLAVLAFGGLTSNVAYGEEEEGLTYYVSPTGDDSTGTGAIEAPFQTPTKARDVVRLQIASGMTEDVTVYFREGDYPLTETFLLTDLDSGRDGYEVIYRSYPGEEAVFNGAETVTGWQLHSGSIYKTDVGTSWTFDTLYEEGIRSVEARYPNTSDGDHVYNRVEAMVTGNSKTQFQYAVSDIPSIADLSSVRAYIWPGGPQGYWNWSTEIVPVADIDESIRIVTLSRAVLYDLGAGSRYFIQGAIELLDQPGEFYLDQSVGMLYYYPHDPSALTSGIKAPKIGNIVKILGNSNSQPAKHIRVEGLTIRNSDSSGAGIHAEQVESITVKNNRIINVGGDGIRFTGWTKQNVIEGNEVHDTGQNGITIRGLLSTVEHISTGNEVLNNHVYRVGDFNGNSGGIRIYHSGENVISYNDVHDIPRHGIHLMGQPKSNLIGTTIGGVLVTGGNYRDYQHTRNNIVEFNDISHATTDSQDAAPLATWGVGPGNIIRNNIVHDSDFNQLTADPTLSFGFGIYMDDDSDDVRLQNNIVHSLQQQGNGVLNRVFLLKGVGIRAENNIIANNNDANGGIMMLASVEETSLGIELSGNIYYNLQDDLYSPLIWDDETIAISDHNLFHHANGTYQFGGSIPTAEYEDWLELSNGQYDQHSLRGDPIFMDQANDDYRPRYDSPAYRLGFEDIDMENVGLTATYPFADEDDPIAQVWLRNSDDTVNRSWVRLETSHTSQLQVTVRTKTGYVADLSTASIMYSSDNASVATVNSLGEIQAIGEGVATITVSVTKDGISKNSAYHVLVDESVASIGVNVHDRIALGESVSAEVYGLSQHGSTMPLDGGTFSYDTSHPLVAVVDTNGVITALTLGTFVLTAEVSIGGELYQATLPMEVYENEIVITEFDNWTTLQGNWEVTMEGDNAVYKSTGSSGSARSYRNDQVLSDYMMTAHIKVDAWTEVNPRRVGVIGRYFNSSNFYYAFYERASQRFQIAKIVNGTVTTLASSSVMDIDFVGTFREFTFILDGSSLSVLLGGEEVVAATDSTFTAGYPGLYAYGQPVTYDNLNIVEGNWTESPDGWNLTTYGTQPALAVEDNGTYHILAGGSNVWGAEDEFGYLNQEVEMPVGGKVTVYAKLQSIEHVTNSTMAGLMMRADDSADAINVFTRMISSGNNQMTVRSSAGSNTTYTSVPNIGVPVELKLVREGDLFTSYYKLDGEWVKHSEKTVIMPNTFLIGLGVCSNDPEQFAEAVFSDVEIVIEEPLPLSDNANLSELELSGMILNQPFDSGNVTYSVYAPHDSESFILTLTAADNSAIVKVNGITLSGGRNSNPIPLNEGVTVITVEVTAPDGATIKTYTIEVIRVTFDSLTALTEQFVNETDAPHSKPILKTMKKRIANAEVKVENEKLKQARNKLNAYIQLVSEQSGNALTTEQAEVLTRWAQQLIDSIMQKEV